MKIVSFHKDGSFLTKTTGTRFLVLVRGRSNRLNGNRAHTNQINKII